MFNYIMPHLSLSSSGLTISYHQGVVKGLMKRGLINTESRFLGTSGGAVTSILTRCNITPDDQHKYTKEILNIVKDKEEKNIAIVLDRYLHDILPLDAAERCTNFIECSMFKFAWPYPHSYMLDYFENKQEVIDATISSCYIPFVIGNSLTWKFRGQRHVDGGLRKENILMQNTDDYIHVASMLKSQVDLYELNDFTNIYMGMNGKMPFDDDVIYKSSYAIHEDPNYFCDSLFELGQLDADAYII